MDNSKVKMIHYLAALTALSRFSGDEMGRLKDGAIAGTNTPEDIVPEELLLKFKAAVEGATTALFSEQPVGEVVGDLLVTTLEMMMDRKK